MYHRAHMLLIVLLASKLLRQARTELLKFLQRVAKAGERSLHHLFLHGGEWAGGVYNYVPWIVDGEIEPFQTEGWTTVTIPFTDFYRYEDGGDYTFEDLLAFRESATYKNFGIFFENSDIKLSDVERNSSEVEFPSSATSVNVYTDNWRIVSLETPAVSDFPD